MKSLITGILAVAAIGTFAVPAFAHDPPQAAAQQQYGQYFGGYQSFDELYQHDVQMLQHSQSDGALTRRQVRSMMNRLRQIRQLEISYRGNDGYIDPREGADIQRRLEQFHDMLHDAHDEGHDAQDNNYQQPYRR